MRKGKIRELVDKVYEITKYEPVPIKSISKHGDSIDKVQRYLQRRGLLLKTGSKKHERVQWNPDAMAPTTTLYDNIYKDHENYLARKRDRRSKPSPKPSPRQQDPPAPIWKQLERFTDEQLMEELLLRRGYIAIERNDDGTANILQEREATIDIRSPRP